MTSVFEQHGGNSSIVCHDHLANLSVSDFFFEKIAYFGHFELINDDSHGFLWLRFYSVWTSSGVIFSHCRERCSASDRVDCKVSSLVSIVYTVFVSRVSRVKYLGNLFFLDNR